MDKKELSVQSNFRKNELSKKPGGSTEYIMRISL
jgi:hypothetical protein